MHSLPPSLLWSHPACPDLPTSHGLNPLFCRPALLLLLENMESDLCPKATKTQKPPRGGRAAKRSMDAEAASPSKEQARVASPDTEKPAGGRVRRPGQQDSMVSPPRPRSRDSWAVVLSLKAAWPGCLHPGETRRAPGLLNCRRRGRQGCTLRDPHSAQGLPLRFSAGDNPRP